MRVPPDDFLILAPLLMAGQAMLVQWAGARERPPAPPDFSAIPAQLGGWKEAGESPLDPEIARELRADRVLNRMYVSSATGAPASLFLAWFQSQRGGAQPHSPKVCLPGSGWIMESSTVITLSTSAGPIAVNLMSVADPASAGPRAVVVYWYQDGGRAMASEWSAKAWVIYDSLLARRSDVELVRIVVWQDAGGQAAQAQAADLAAEIYPLVRPQNFRPARSHVKLSCIRRPDHTRGA